MSSTTVITVIGGPLSWISSFFLIVFAALALHFYLKAKRLKKEKTQAENNSRLLAEKNATLEQQIQEYEAGREAER